MEHAPGPRGSPQLPHAPAEGEALAVPFAATANTESCRARFLLWHLGHSAFWFPYTKASNPWSHSLQTYSKMGMIRLLATTYCISIRIDLWGVRKPKSRGSFHVATCAADTGKPSPAFSFRERFLCLPRKSAWWRLSLACGFCATATGSCGDKVP